MQVILHSCMESRISTFYSLIRFMSVSDQCLCTPDYIDKVAEAHSADGPADSVYLPIKTIFGLI